MKNPRTRGAECQARIDLSIGITQMVWDDGHKLQNNTYLIQQVLGQGGFCVTYRALYFKGKKTVIVKAPNEQLKNDPQYGKYIQRFSKEAQQLRGILKTEPPYLASVYDLFIEPEEIPCLVLEYIEGESLFTLVEREGILSIPKALKIIHQIGQGLSRLHEQGLTHRAAYPKNIILAHSGSAILVNYGLASEIVPTAASFKFLAHPAFIAYEQMAGSKEPSVDIYSLAASLYYCLTAQLPASALERLNNHPLIEPKDYNPLIYERLNQIILQGMGLQASKRPERMQDWLELLETISDNSPQSSSNSSLPLIITPKQWQQEKYPQQANDSKGMTWPWLLGVPVSLALLGFICAAWPWSQVLVTIVAGLGSWLVIRFGSDAGAFAGAVAGGISWLVVVLGTLVWANTPQATFAVLLAVALTSLGAWFITLAGAVEGLLKIYRPFITLIILAGFSWMGLGIGWLLYQQFPIWLNSLDPLRGN